MTTTEAALRDALEKARSWITQSRMAGVPVSWDYQQLMGKIDAALSQPPASSTAGEAYELGYRQAVIDGENSRFLSSLAQPLSPLSGDPASPLDQVMQSNPGWQEITQADRDALDKIMASSGLPADILTILVAHRMAGEPELPAAPPAQDQGEGR